jgi:hypothetical protein
MKIKTITKKEYDLLISLKKQAEKQDEILELIANTATKILNEEDDPFGHISEFVYGCTSLDSLLDYLDIQVEE